MAGSTTLLIVDDSSENLKLLGNSLKKSGYTVLAALNGKQAVALAESKQPDLILLDVMMPEINGFEVCLILKKNKLTQNIPVIFLTASVEPESIKTGFEVGGVDYIAKPFNHEELTLRVTNHLNYKKKKDDLEKKLVCTSLILKNIGEGVLSPLHSQLKTDVQFLKSRNSLLLNSLQNKLAFVSNTIQRFAENTKDFHKTLNETTFETFDLNTVLQTLKNTNSTDRNEGPLDFKIQNKADRNVTYFGDKTNLCKALTYTITTLNQLAQSNLRISGTVKNKREGEDTILIEFSELDLTDEEQFSDQINQSVKLITLTVLNDLLYPFDGKATFIKDSENRDSLLLEISLKRKSEELESETKESSSESLHSILNKKEILVVEDNDLNQILITTILQSQGAIITLANTGKEAFEKATSKNYHLILMDINIPLVSGIEVTKILRSEHGLLVPIIGISGHSDKKTINNCLNAGMNSFLLKPFEISDLKEVVYNQLKQNETIGISTDSKNRFLDSTYKEEINKYDLTKLIELSNGDQELITNWTNHFKNLVDKGILEIKLIIESDNYTSQNKIFHELNNYTTYFGVELLKEYLKDLPKIQKSATNNEIANHFKLIAEELTSIKDYFILIETEN